jgi:murein DD-endopeptidase MepM/ murein hydrolase activator NlpD
VHFAARAINNLCESSCDAEVLHGADVNERKTYCETMINVAQHHATMNTALSTSFFGGRNGMKNRILNIMDTRKKKMGAVIACTIMLSVVLAGGLFAVQAEPAEPIEPAYSADAPVFDDLVETSLVTEQERQIEQYAEDADFLWPVPRSNTVSSPFGPRVNPVTEREEHHNGISIPAATGERIAAAADGYVVFAGWGAGLGNHIILSHANGYRPLYAHASRNRVQTGQEVTRGQHIADAGATGMAAGSHLYFEIQLHGEPVDPMGVFEIH